MRTTLPENWYLPSIDLPAHVLHKANQWRNDISVTYKSRSISGDIVFVSKHISDDSYYYADTLKNFEYALNSPDSSWSKVDPKPVRLTPDEFINLVYNPFVKMTNKTEINTSDIFPIF